MENETGAEERRRAKIAIDELDEISYSIHLRNHKRGPFREAIRSCLNFLSWFFSVKYTPIDKVKSIEYTPSYDREK